MLEECTRGQGGWIWGVGQSGGRVGMGQQRGNCGPHHSSGLMLRAIGSYREYESRDSTGHEVAGRWLRGRTGGLGTRAL